MASSVLECEVCNEDYNFTQRKPLSLPCGHTFCRRCLQRISSTANNKCPRCRHILMCEVENLPTIYALIPPSPRPSPETQLVPRADRCESHGCNLNYFCANCEELICRKCLKHVHAHHRVEFIDDVVARDELSTRFTAELDGKIKAKIDRLTRAISLSNDIFQSVNEMDDCRDGVLQYKDSLQSLLTSTNQDLETWQDGTPRSAEETRKIFKKLCRYYGDCKATSEEQMLAALCTKLDDLTAAVRKFQDVAENLKACVTEDDRRPHEAKGAASSIPCKRNRKQCKVNNERTRYFDLY